MRRNQSPETHPKTQPPQSELLNVKYKQREMAELAPLIGATGRSISVALRSSLTPSQDIACHALISPLFPPRAMRRRKRITACGGIATNDPVYFAPEVPFPPKFLLSLRIGACRIVANPIPVYALWTTPPNPPTRKLHLLPPLHIPRPSMQNTLMVIMMRIIMNPVSGAHTSSRRTIR